MRILKYASIAAGLLIAIAGYRLYVHYARDRAVARLQQKIDSLGFKPGDRYCYATDATKDSNGYWPTSYTEFEELMESLRAHDPVAPRDLMANSVHIDPGYEILILDTSWSSPIYTKGRIASVPPRSPTRDIGEVIYTLASFQILDTVPLSGSHQRKGFNVLPKTSALRTHAICKMLVPN